MATTKAAREETKDYYDLAIEQIKAEQEKPFGAMEQKHAIVLLRGLQNQNYNDLKQIKDDFPAVWDKYKSKSKSGKWIFPMAAYKELIAFAKGESTVGTQTVMEEL